MSTVNFSPHIILTTKIETCVYNGLVLLCIILNEQTIKP